MAARRRPVRGPDWPPTVRAMYCLPSDHVGHRRADRDAGQVDRRDLACRSPCRARRACGPPFVPPRVSAPMSSVFVRSGPLIELSPPSGGRLSPFSIGCSRRSAVAERHHPGVIAGVHVDRRHARVRRLEAAAAPAASAGPPPRALHVSQVALLIRAVGGSSRNTENVLRDWHVEHAGFGIDRRARPVRAAAGARGWPACRGCRRLPPATAACTAAHPESLDRLRAPSRGSRA